MVEIVVVNGTKVGIKRKRLVFSCHSVGCEIREFEDSAVSVTFDQFRIIELYFLDIN